MRLSTVLRRPPPAAPPPAEPLETATLDLEAAISSMAQQASQIGRGAAEVRGVIEDSGKNSARSAQAVASLAAQVGEIDRAQGAIGDVSNAGLAAVGRVREAVTHVGAEVGTVVATLREVAEAAASIAQIAVQTRLVAFNASVEAHRAGDAGRGFGAVANAVKELAGKVESSSKEIMRTVGVLDRRVDVLARELRFDDTVGGTPQGRFQQALADMQRSVSSILEAAEKSAGICGGLDTQMTTIATEIGGTTRALDTAMKRSETFLDVSEKLIELIADCGIETEDTPYICASMASAGRIGALLEQALESGAISLADLFDANYQPIPHSQPAQHTTRFVGLADRLFPEVQEAALALSPKVVFCIAVDRNGYVATHNRIYCQPQRGDPVWDAANSRYRRIFNDRTGLASARNQRPFLLQTYRRDMGGGQFIVMKEASAPIMVDGRHWGGLRLAFKF